MNPVTRRRWQTFKSNRRAFYCLWFFGLCFALSLCAEFIANDRPLVVSYDSRLYFPIFQNLDERTFGGDMPIATDFTDPLIERAVEKNGWAVWPPIRYSFSTISRQEGVTFPAPPGSANWLGTDDQGRDIVARLLYGFRISVLFGLCLSFFGCAVGMMAGVMQGYYGGLPDLLFQRFMEIWSGIPVLYLIIIISSVITMGFWALLALMLAFSWMRVVGVVRAESLRARNMEYVCAARALGVPDRGIMLRHVLPNAVVALISILPFLVNSSIVTLTSLDFLGFGLPPEYPSLGELVVQGKNNLFAPWIGLSAFFTLAGMLTCLVFIGEGLRDAFDPRIFISSSDQWEEQA
ncbi:MAG: Inner membrane ABC transporter permease protein YejE [Desulfovibrio sp.]